MTETVPILFQPVSELKFLFFAVAILFLNGQRQMKIFCSESSWSKISITSDICQIFIPKFLTEISFSFSFRKDAAYSLSQDLL